MANTNINIAELDFDLIKSTLKTYLKNQSQFNDYDFEGSVISTVLDVLSYNTHYNAFYLNMVANEMFLDTALKRSSVISHAKLMNYVPQSSLCSIGIINAVFTGVIGTALTIPKYTKFYSEPKNGVNYPFVTLDAITVPVSNSTATFSNVYLHQGQPISYSFTVDKLTNPKLIFKLPDGNIDTSTLIVYVYPYLNATNYDIYNLATTYLTLDGTSKVYFIQESLDGFYEIYFGDGILGQTLTTSNIVVVEYLTSKSTDANGIGKFTLMENLGNYTAVSITTTQKSQGGRLKESIDSIKFHAPKSFSAQNRAVTKEDYITAIQQNKFGYSFDSVNVWGGETNVPPVYGQVFVSMKPTGGYVLTETQKSRLINDVIKPISVMTVEPTIVEPDFTYIKISVDVLYDPKLSVLTAAQLQTNIKNLIQTFSDTSLNTFNSIFLASNLNILILNADKSIITNEIKVQLQKKFYPNLITPSTYNFYFGTSLKKGLFSEGVSSYPAIKFRDKENLSNIIDGIYIDELPSATVGVDSISIINSGFGYSLPPKINIIGDGTGATATAILSSTGYIKSVVVTNSGFGYTSAIAEVIPDVNDTPGGRLGAVIVNLQGKLGILRLYYNTNNGKTIYNENIGTIDYEQGIVTLNSFNPIEVDNPLGQLTVTTTPISTIFSSSFNRIITVDPFDPYAINVNVIAKLS